MDKNAILDNIDSTQVPTTIPTTSLIETQKNNESLLQQLLSNKLYIYIIIGIIILDIASYYLYIKYFSKNKKEEQKELEEIEEKNERDEILKEPETKKHIISSDIEYYLLDHTGNPIFINKYFNNFLNNSREQSVLINNNLIKQKRPKLIHPNQENFSDNQDNQDNQDNEDIEDTNITNQDLTREEIEELKKQLELMQRKKNSSITAENDEDNEEGTF